jgi:hypothetical protein
MNIHVTYLSPVQTWEGTLAPKFVELINSSQSHNVVSNPKESDIVLIVDGHQCQSIDITTRIRDVGLSRYLDKVVLYDQSDRPKPRLRTVAPSINSHLLAELHSRGYSSETTIYATWPTDMCTSRSVDPDNRGFLWNYVGAVTHPFRLKLINVLASGHGGYIRDTTNPGARLIFEQYMAILSNSTFTLCPRGHGHSSWRVYESLSNYSVPVILSDRFAYPRGLELENGSIKIPESVINNASSNGLLENLNRSVVVDVGFILEKLRHHNRFETMMADVHMCLSGTGLLGDEDSFMRLVSSYHNLVDKVRNRLIYHVR